MVPNEFKADCSEAKYPCRVVLPTFPNSPRALRAWTSRDEACSILVGHGLAGDKAGLMDGERLNHSKGDQRVHGLTMKSE